MKARVKFGSTLVLLLSLLGVWLFATEVQAQQFSAAFGAELQFTPAPITLNATIFDVLLAVSVSDAAFSSLTTFDLLTFQSQLFSIELLVGGLVVRDRLLFEPALDFKKNSLNIAIQMLGFRLGATALLEELGPPSPDVNPGLVVEAGGRTSFGIGLTSFTGFGVAQIVEDIVTTEPCISIELRCLGDPYPDDQFDRIVVKPFIFNEQAIRVDAQIHGVTFGITPLLTLSGFTKLLIDASLSISNPNLRFASFTTLDSSFFLARQMILFEASIGPIGWRALTIFSGVPIVFEAQTFKMRFSYAGFNLYTTAIFTTIGLGEIRLGAGFNF